MNKKKLMVLGLAAAMTAGVFGSAASAEENGAFSVWVWDPAFSIYSMEEAEKIYQQDHPEFDLDVIETSWSDVQTKVITMVESGNLEDLPDVFCVQDFAFQNLYENYPEAFADIAGTSINFDDFVDYKMGYSTYGETQVGIPFDTGTAIYAVRTDVLEQAGYTVADVTDIDWNQFIEIGKQVLEKTGNPLIVADRNGNDLINMMVMSAGGSYFDEEGNAYIADNELLKKSIEIYKELVDTGVLALVESWDQFIAAFTAEDGAAKGVISGCWILASVQLAEESAGKWAVTNIPKLPDVEGATNYSNQGGSTWVISSNCKDVDAVADFFAATFGGNSEFFATVFPSTGLISPSITVANSGIYDTEQEFFGGQKVYQDIAEFSKQVPLITYGKYYNNAQEAIKIAVSSYIDGGDLDEALKAAQEELEFAMFE